MLYPAELRALAGAEDTARAGGCLLQGPDRAPSGPRDLTARRGSAPLEAPGAHRLRPWALRGLGFLGGL